MGRIYASNRYQISHTLSLHSASLLLVYLFLDKTLLRSLLSNNFDGIRISREYQLGGILSLSAITLRVLAPQYVVKELLGYHGALRLDRADCCVFFIFPTEK